MSLLFIAEQVVAEVLTPLPARDSVVQALHAQAAQRAGLSEPRGLFLRAPEQGSAYHVKGGFLTDSGVGGFRIGGFPRAGVAPHGTHLMVLTDLDSTAPIALVSADALTAIRVGTAIAVAIAALRSGQADTLALIGSGRLARGALRAIQATTPFATVRVATRTPEGGRRFQTEMQAEGAGRVTLAESAEAACRDAHVILTLTNARTPLVQAEWCGSGSLLVSAGGGQECEPRAVLGADAIFVDDWAQCAVLGDIAALHREGKISEADIAGTIAEVVSGHIPGRRSQTDRIVAVPQGLTLLDIALAHRVYLEAQALGLGTRLEWP